MIKNEYASCKREKYQKTCVKASKRGSAIDVPLRILQKF